MEPVSLVASIVTLLEGTAETTRILLRVKNAAQELHLLNTELTELCRDLETFRARASQLETFAKEEDIQYMLDAIIKATITIDRTKALIVRKLSSNKGHRPSLRFLGYLKGDRLQRLHRDIRTRKEELRLCFATSWTIEMVYTVSDRATGSTSSDYADITPEIGDKERTQSCVSLVEITSCPPYRPAVGPVKPPSIQETEMQHSATSIGLPTVNRTTGFGLEECSRWCQCQCHSTYALRTPSWMNHVVGTMFCQYADGPVQNRDCNTITCQGANRRASFEYAFPTWAFRMAFVVRGGWTQPGGISGSWSLKVPMYIPDTALELRRLLGTSAGNHQQLYEYMHKHRIQPNAREPTLDNTLLDLALAHNNFGVCNFLLDLGADLNAFGSGPDASQSWSPAKHAWFRLLTTDSSNDPEAEILKNRLKKAGTLDFFHLSTTHKIIAGLCEGSLTERLSAHPEDLTAGDPYGNPPLSWAARKGNVKAVKTLLYHGADVTAGNAVGTTALHMAARGNFDNSIECVHSLIDNGANVNALNDLPNASARSPLAFAVTAGNLQIVDLLLCRGALPDPPGFPPLAEAAFQGRADIMRRLMAKGADIDRLTIHGYPAIENVVCSHEVACVQILLDAGASLNYVDNKGLNVLDSAACDADIEIMKLLARSKIRGLDTSAEARKRYWEKFNKQREYSMPTRQPLEDERAAFENLLNSVTDIVDVTDIDRGE